MTIIAVPITIYHKILGCSSSFGAISSGYSFYGKGTIERKYKFNQEFSRMLFKAGVSGTNASVEC